MSFCFTSGVLHELLLILTVFKVGAAVPHFLYKVTVAWGGKLTCQSHEKAVVKPGLETWSDCSALPCHSYPPLPLSPAPVLPQTIVVPFPRVESSRRGWWGHTLRKVYVPLWLPAMVWDYSLKAGQPVSSHSQGAWKTSSVIDTGWMGNGLWVRGCGGGAERQIGCRTKKVHGSWDAMEPSRLVPMRYHQFSASPAVFLETENGFVCA